MNTMNEIDRITFNHPADDAATKLFLGYMKEQQQRINRFWLTRGSPIKWRGRMRFSKKPIYESKVK
jgi:hypothetical protein